MAAAVAVGAVLGALLHSFGVGEPSPVGAEAAAAEDRGSASVGGAVVEREEGVPTAAVTAGETGVLRIEAGGCGAVRQASATVVDDGGRVVVLTNAHVVRGSGTALVRSPSGAVVSAQVTGSVQGRDAAVLELDEGDTHEVEALEIGPPPQVGHELVVVGHPEGHLHAGSGVLRAIERRAGYDGSSDVLLVDSQVRGGSSGGAVLDAEGRLVGLVAAKDPSTGWAVAYPIAEVLGRGSGVVPGC